MSAQVLIERLTEVLETQTHHECPMDLRKILYSKIISTEDYITVELGGNITLQGNIENRVIQFGYDIYISPVQMGDLVSLVRSPLINWISPTQTFYLD
eukprot:sb/3478854/